MCDIWSDFRIFVFHFSNRLMRGLLTSRAGKFGDKHCKRHKCVGGVMAVIEMEQQPFQDAATSTANA